eukprot:2517618-Amphidinium_carterae.1
MDDVRASEDGYQQSELVNREQRQHLRCTHLRCSHQQWPRLTIQVEVQSPWHEPTFPKMRRSYRGK